jgi:hypothetical protein
VVGLRVIKQLRYSKSLNLQTADSACFELKGTLRAPTNPNTGDRIIGAETATFCANKFEIHLSDTTTNSETVLSENKFKDDIPDSTNITCRARLPQKLESYAGL